MGRRKSIIRQGTEKLLSMAAFGDSKHSDMLANGGFPAIDKIYSTATMDNYIDCISRFLRWAQTTHGCRYLEEAREYIADYLNKRIETQSAWTVRLEAAAIAKVYQIHTTELGVDLPLRHCDDIVQHRQAKWVGHFSPTKHAELVAFCLAAGLRRHEVAKVKPGDVYEENGNVYVETVGKGGKFRKAICLNTEPLRIAQAAALEGKELVFARIPKYAPIHEYRATYAQTMYARLTRPVEEIPPRDRYVCRGSRRGEIYDAPALAEVSKNLGHQRLDVVVDNYLHRNRQDKCCP